MPHREPGRATGIGPNLYGVVGAAHGHVAGFAYSDALASIAGPWDFDALDEWLTSPRKYAPGTKMTFAGLSDPQDRADVIAYMNAQGSNLPLPEAPALHEEGEGEDVGETPSGAEAEANVEQGPPTADMEDQVEPGPVEAAEEDNEAE